MLGALKGGGIRQIAFAGGDPALRSDLRELVGVAHELGMDVEIQTNAHNLHAKVISVLLEADLIGVSLDGATAASHDRVRGRRGNFDRVLRLMSLLDSEQRPFVVRTVVSRMTTPDVTGIGAVLNQYKSLRRWSLVQFSAVEDGFRNRNLHEISDEDFRTITGRCDREYVGAAEVNIYALSAKRGVYFLIGSNGDAYRNLSISSAAEYSVAGNLLKCHALNVATALGVDSVAHRDRYENLL